MLISVAKENNISISGILHVGANDCAEYEEYCTVTNNIIWIEGNPKIVDFVKQTKPNIQIYSGLITDKNNELVDFNISNNDSQSSSILEFNLHKKSHPSIKFIDKIQLYTNTIDTFIDNNNINSDNINAIVLDIQGVELRALKGATKLLENIKIICSEVNTDETYTNCDKIYEIDTFLAKYNFRRIYTHIWNGHTYGNAVYIKY